MFLLLHDRRRGIYDTVGTFKDRTQACAEGIKAIQNGSADEYLVVKEMDRISPKPVRREAEVTGLAEE